jgi:hypothetical protein
METGRLQPGQPKAAGSRGGDELVYPAHRALGVLALTECSPATDGPGQAPVAPYQQGDPRDTGGMH